MRVAPSERSNVVLVESGRRRPDGKLVVAAVVSLVAAVVGAVCVFWPIDALQLQASSVVQPSVYEAETAWLLVILAGAAVVGLVRRPFIDVGVTVCFCAALGLVGTGVSAYRRWNTSKGFSVPAGNLSELRALSLVLAAVMTAAVLAAMFALRARFAATAHERTDTELAHVAAAIAIAVTVPLAMGWEPDNRTTQLGAHLLMYGLPWAGAALIGSIGSERTRAAALATPIAAGAILFVTDPMIPAPRPWLGVIAAAVVLGALAFVAGIDADDEPPVPVGAASAD